MRGALRRRCGAGLSFPSNPATPRRDRGAALSGAGRAAVRAGLRGPIRGTWGLHPTAGCWGGRVLTGQWGSGWGGKGPYRSIVEWLGWEGPCRSTVECLGWERSLQVVAGVVGVEGSLQVNGGVVGWEGPYRSTMEWLGQKGPCRSSSEPSDCWGWGRLCPRSLHGSAGIPIRVQEELTALPCGPTVPPRAELASPNP